ncbi:MAG: phosphatidate cytidylyltransferase [Spongiibacteraceae bacterium]
MLKQRLVTAIIMALLLVGGIVLLAPVGLAVLFGVLVLVAAWEWSAMAGLSSRLAKVGFTFSTLCLLALVAWHTQLLTDLINLNRVRDVLGLACLWWSIALLWVKSYPASAIIWKSVAARILMGWLTLVPAWLALVYLRMHVNGIALIVLLLAIVATADIGAYFSGRAWGKSKLAAEVSPGKSWAGFWGGLVATITLVAVLWWLLDDARHGLVPVLVVALLTSLASVLGDLLESMVKRHQGLKDSGRILPGHGGLMDRLDSMTAAAPVFALSLILMGW